MKELEDMLELVQRRCQSTTDFYAVKEFLNGFATAGLYIG